MNKRRGLINFLIVMTLLIVFVVGCSVLLRSGGGDAVTDDGTGAGGNGGGAATMNFDQFQSIALETTRDQLIEEYGEPTPREEVIAEGIITDDATTQNCIYYRADPPTFGEWFEFCFEGDSLVNKNSL